MSPLAGVPAVASLRFGRRCDSRTVLGNDWNAESVQTVLNSKRMNSANLVLALAARRGLP
jgi:hypothetical protein